MYLVFYPCNISKKKLGFLQLLANFVIFSQKNISIIIYINIMLIVGLFIIKIEIIKQVLEIYVKKDSTYTRSRVKLFGILSVTR